MGFAKIEESADVFELKPSYNIRDPKPDYWSQGFICFINIVYLFLTLKELRRLPNSDSKRWLCAVNIFEVFKSLNSLINDLKYKVEITAPWRTPDFKKNCVLYVSLSRTHCCRLDKQLLISKRKLCSRNLYSFLVKAQSRWFQVFWKNQNLQCLHFQS